MATKTNKPDADVEPELAKRKTAPTGPSEDAELPALEDVIGEPEESEAPVPAPHTLREGASVLYVLAEGANAGHVRPATIVARYGTHSHLVVDILPDDGLPMPHVDVSVPHDPSKRPGTWHWPE